MPYAEPVRPRLTSPRDRILKADLAVVRPLPPSPRPSQTWLTKAYHSPYYNDSHRKLQKAMRAVVDEIVYPDAQACEDSGKCVAARPTLSCSDACCCCFCQSAAIADNRSGLL